MNELKIEAFNNAKAELSVTFIKARDAHEEAVTDYQKKKAAFEAFPLNVPSNDYKTMARKEEARADYNTASSAIYGKVSDIWRAFSLEAQRIRARLADATENGGTLSALDVDEKAVILLKSGMMKAGDYRQMAEQFTDNQTMTRLVAQYGEKYAERLDEPEERSAMNFLLHELRKSPLSEFDKLVNVAHTMSGTDEDGNFISESRMLSELATGHLWESLVMGAQ